MPALRVHSFSLSFDGYGAGPDQGPDDPMGVGGGELHGWAFATQVFGERFGHGGGGTGVDNEMILAGDRNVGATIIGRNMFGPIRGPWMDYSWQGWWGAEPPYHHPVFVVTHHLRPALTLGETTFHFTDDPIESVLEQAIDAAAGRDVRLGGGVSLVRQYLAAGLVDELHLATAPVVLGNGEHLLANLGPLPSYRITSVTPGEAAIHTILSRIP